MEHTIFHIVEYDMVIFNLSPQPQQQYNPWKLPLGNDDIKIVQVLTGKEE